jgi:putative ABC transport system substrate-binding protein
MRRRDFIALLGGAAAAWPLVARAQSDGRRRVGVLMNVGESDAQGRARLDAFVQRLKELGWSEGRNLRLDVRWGAGDAELFRRYANELLVLAPDVIVANASVTVAALQQVTRQVPIVFAGVIDPVGGGFVKSLARPGGNTTGFTIFSMPRREMARTSQGSRRV